MYRIMLVDDEPLILRGLQSIVDWLEYNIEVAYLANDGVQALQMFERDPCEIVLTDIRMPYMNGLDLIKAIRDIAPRTKCIVLSGYDDAEYLHQCIRLGIEEYLLKPVNADDLSEILIQIVDRLNMQYPVTVPEIQEFDLLKQSVLLGWAHGRLRREAILERFERLLLPINGYKCAMIGFRCETRSQNEILKFCKKYLPEPGGNMVFLDFDGDIIAPVLSRDVETLNEKLSMFQKMAAKEFGQIDFAAGVTVQDALIVSPSYYNLKRRLAYPGGMAFMQNSVGASSIQQLFPFFRMHFFLVSLHCDIPGIIRSYDRFCELANRMEVLDETEKMLDILRSIDLTRDASECIQRDLRAEDASSIRDNFINGWIHEVKKMENTRHPIVNRVIQHICEHYSDELSIKLIASNFNINAAYLGQIFKAETGELLSQYINMVRLDRAIQIFTDEPNRISSIAAQVGFPTQNYFYTVFKRVLGLSTTEFKTLIQY